MYINKDFALMFYSQFDYIKNQDQISQGIGE